jgi:predicted acylesterase/phospholipase RssA
MTRSRYSLLTIDGGGIRGAIPARVIQEIETRMNRPACELFDMIAGTSTGGIIALGLSKPSADGQGPAYRASDLLELYVDHGRELFPDSLLLKIRSLGGLADVRYPTGPLENLVKDKFGDTNLSDAVAEVTVPSYDLSRPGPFFFKRRYTLEDAAYDVKMWQVARATSAAPTYFEPAKVAEFKDEGDHALVDGGVYANNPAVAAYADAVELWGEEAEIQVVSIGTGQPPDDHPQHGGIPVPYENAQHWGLARWAHPMLDVVFDGIAKAVEYQMLRLCRQQGTLHYHRLQSSLPTASHAMDDASPENIAKLVADAETLLHEQRDVVDAICSALETVAADRDTAAPAGVG